MAITPVKIVRLIKILKRKSLHKVYFKKLSDINHLYILESMVYMFIHEEVPDLKSEKFEAQALKNILVDFNSHIIYWVFIQS